MQAGVRAKHTVSLKGFVLWPLRLDVHLAFSCQRLPAIFTAIFSGPFWLSRLLDFPAIFSLFLSMHPIWVFPKSLLFPLDSSHLSFQSPIWFSDHFHVIWFSCHLYLNFFAILSLPSSWFSPYLLNPSGSAFFYVFRPFFPQHLWFFAILSCPRFCFPAIFKIPPSW